MKSLVIASLALAFLGVAVSASQAGGIQVQDQNGNWVPYTPPPAPPIGGSSYNPWTGHTTTVILHPQRPVGGGMLERAHREIIVERGNTMHLFSGRR